MTEKHYLYDWKQYLRNEDYEYLIKYIENIKNNIPNNKMIILSGLSRTGKSTLKNDILTYLGEICQNLPTEYEFNILNYEVIPKLGLYSGFDDLTNIRSDKIFVNSVINLIKYKQQSLIADTMDYESLDNKLIQYSRIIKMEYIF
jgi:hypothetical protein